jgi:hypothetical protein
MRLFKVIASGMMALLCLNAFCLVYYKIPFSYPSKTGVTDLCYGEHNSYSRMVEGFGYGRMNNEGFNNLEDYNEQPVDILVMGASHMEAFQVPQHKTTVALLNRFFEHTKYVYNIGISSHFFPRVVNNFEAAVRYYEPKEYVVIETGSIQFNVQELEDGLHQRLSRIPAYYSKIRNIVQKILPYLRLLNYQLKTYLKMNKPDTEKSIAVFNREQYAAVLDAVMKRLSQIGAEHDLKILIFYHPYFTLNYDGSIAEKTDYAYLTMFENACRDNNITFVTMAPIFIEAYKNNHVLPHGFLNTAVGAGHLNQTGHRLIAGELFRLIGNSEKDGSL